MENASKALLMAGGVLIAIIIISLLVKTYGNIGAFQRQQISAEEAERIEEYNKEYTKYLSQYVYGTEVITVINKALNEKQMNNLDIKVAIKFTVDTYTYTKRYYTNNGTKKEETKTIKKGGEFILNTETDEIDTFEGFINTKNDDGTINENVEQLKSKVFKCDKIEFDNTGRVNYIHFIEINYVIQDSYDWQ